MNEAVVIGLLSISVFVIMLMITIHLHHRYPGSFGIMVAGGLGYFFAQALLQMPFIPLLELDSQRNTSLLLVIGLVVALTASIARYLIVKWALSDRLSWSGALSAGMGQGFCETLFLFVILYFLQMMVMQISMESGEVLADTIFNRSLLYVIVDLLSRIAAICFHISMYLVLVRGFLKKQAIKSFLLVWLFQAGFTLFLYYFETTSQNLWMSAAAILLIAALSLIYIIQTYRLMDKDNQIHFDKDAGEKALEEGY